VLIETSFIKRQRTVFILVSTFQLILFHALRDPFIYKDTGNYLAYYNSISSVETFLELFRFDYLGAALEPGYVIFNYVLSLIYDSDYTIFIASSIVIVGGYMYAVYKYSYFPLLSILIILIYPVSFQQSFFVLRQHMACAILMYAIQYVYRRKLLYYILYVFLATLFHYSAIVLLPLYWLYKIAYKKNKVIVFASLMVFSILFRYIVVYVTSVERYSYYQEEARNSLAFLLLSITLMLTYYGVKTKYVVLSSIEKMTIIYNIYGVIICFLVVGMSLGRLTNYFTFFLAIIIPLLLKLLPKYIGIIVVTVFMVFIFLLNYLDQSIGTFYYKLLSI
jgi:transmembrane protein EpsG